MASLGLRKLVKFYGDTEVVHAIDLEVAHNEFVALVGPSGCGKSTTLRMIAGLEDVSAGEILIDDQVVNEIAPRNRDIAMVFQDYALYPHMSVHENLSFGLQVQRVPKADIEARVREAADILNIGALLERKPKQLSGGQRQRVAMGRAIVRRPKVFLFDEPLSNLDAKLRVQMRTEIKKLHQRVATTVVYVTHDQVEAMTLADRIVVLRGGVIEQVGTPDDVYNRPASLFVAGFIGSPAMNFVPGKIDANGKEAAIALTDGIRLGLPRSATENIHHQLAAGREVTVGIRPEHFSLAGEREARLTPRVDVIEPLGSDTLVFFRLGAAEIIARLPPTTRVAVGDAIPLAVDSSQIHCFDPATEKAIR